MPTAKVLDLTRQNVELNGLGPEQRRGAASGYAEVEELEWGKEGYEVSGSDCLPWVGRVGLRPGFSHGARGWVLTEEICVRRTAVLRKLCQCFYRKAYHVMA